MAHSDRDGRKGGSHKPWKQYTGCGCCDWKGRPDRLAVRRQGRQEAQFELNEHRRSWWLDDE